MKVAIIGTVGVPACYGGFETLAENLIGDLCSQNIEYTVFCSSKDIEDKKSTYKNAKLKYIPLKANGIEGMLYDFVSLLRVLRGYDVILYLGANIPITRLYKFLCSAKIVINIDGLSQFRDKYSKWQKKYLAYIKNNEIKMADIIVVDNAGIQEYVSNNYDLPSKLIAYGGDQAVINVTDEAQQQILSKYSLIPKTYYTTVCRIEPENNCHVILDAFKQTGKKIIFIGNWEKSEYGRNLKSQYSQYPNIIMQNPIYDLETLYVIRNNAEGYIHGHSVGGTNPSLVEAMFFGIPIYCFDVIYNRATTHNKAGYFSSAQELADLILKNPINGPELKKIAKEYYTWKSIVSAYEKTYVEALSS